MDKQALIKRLMDTFLGEYEERLQGMSRDLLALEKAEPGSAEYGRLLHSLLRDAHSLKGAARAVDLDLIESSCHRLEEILAALKKDPSMVEAPLFQLLFSALDGLTEVGQRLRAEKSLEDSLLAGVLLEMELYVSAVLNAGEPEPAPAPAPAPAPENKKSGGRPSRRSIPLREPVAIKPAAPGEVPPETSPSAAQELLTVRIDTEKLDSLLSRSGELLGARQRLGLTAEHLSLLSDSLNRLNADWRFAKERHAREEYDGAAPEGKKLPPRLQELYEQTSQRLQALQTELERARHTFLRDFRQLDQAGRALDEQVRRIRMLPFSHSCIGFDRMVRDLARAAGKDAELHIDGGDVEMDRSILEGLKDPLRHLIRNAVDHGIERPEERQRLGKPARGRISASASLRGGQVQVVVADDGRGLGVDAIRRRAQQMQLPLPEDDREIAQVVFMPGFSTAADSVSLVSGRGIGLDVVKTQIKALHGEIEVSFVPEQGTSFQLIVPLTLTLLRMLLLKVEKQVFAISNSYVHRLMRVRRSDLQWIGERPMLLVDNRPIPLLLLAQVLGISQDDKLDWQAKLPVVVVSLEDRQVAFVVDELLAEQEVIVKSLGARVQRIRNVAGGVILPSGQVALTLHIADLFHTALSRSPNFKLWQGQKNAPKNAPAEKRKRRILVVDDSVTTRSLERSLLEAAGFLVEVAADGAAGWERVQSGGIDLVLSDVDMPRKNGYELTMEIRRSERFRRLPVILITSNDDAKSKERGMQAGASAYMVKGEFDQNVLLSLLEQLL